MITATPKLTRDMTIPFPVYSSLSLHDPARRHPLTPCPCSCPCACGRILMMNPGSRSRAMRSTTRPEGRRFTVTRGALQGPESAPVRQSFTPPESSTEPIPAKALPVSAAVTIFLVRWRSRAINNPSRRSSSRFTVTLGGLW